MSDYIKRDNALDIVANNNVHGEITLDRYDRIIDGIYDIPSEDVVPVRHGRWEDYEENTWQCSECGELFYLEDGTPQENEYRYCPNCGAKMDKERRR